MTTVESPDASRGAGGPGELLRTWRAKRRMSQLDLATQAEVSTRHLSYVETGRSTPSRELLLHLARHLDVPHREQNDLLLAAGYAPAYTQFDLDDPAMQPVVAALTTMLAASEPNPTLVMDRHWNLVLANESALAWTAGVDPVLLEPPINVLRLTLGLRDRIVNLDEVGAHLVHRLRRQFAVSGDPELADLVTECAAQLGQIDVHPIGGAVALPVKMRQSDGSVRTYLSVIATFGSALDVTASELTIESFYDVTPS